MTRADDRIVTRIAALRRRLAAVPTNADEEAEICGAYLEFVELMREACRMCWGRLRIVCEFG